MPDAAPLDEAVLVEAADRLDPGRRPIEAEFNDWAARQPTPPIEEN